MNHDLEFSLSDNCSSLASITEDTELFVCFLIFQTDEGIDGIVVTCSRLPNCVIPSWSKIKHSLLLFKTHRVSIESISILVVSFDVEGHFFSGIIGDGNGI